MEGCPSLLVVNVQLALFERSTPIHAPSERISVGTGLVERALRPAPAVGFIRHANTLMPHRMDGWRLHRRLPPRNGDVFVDKAHGDAFEASSLDDEFRARGVANLVVTGLVSYGCVVAKGPGPGL